MSKAKSVKTKVTKQNITKDTKAFNKLLLVVLLPLIVLVIIPAFYYGAGWVVRTNSAVDRTSVDVLATYVINAAEGLKKVAPVEPITGDVYFPQARLRIPATSTSTTITYAYDSSNPQDPELSISSKNIVSFNASKLIGAKNVDELFLAVPQLQACQRGITLKYNKFDSEGESANDLIQTITLNNGKELFMYQDKQCPELNDLTELLKNIQAY